MKDVAGGSVRVSDRASARRLLDGLTITATAQPDQAVRRAWDDLVARTVNSDVSQLSGWATLRGEVGYRPLYLLASSGPSLLGGALVLRRTPRGIGSIGYLPYGPVLSDELVHTRPLVLDRLVGALSLAARELGALFVQPPDGGEDVVLELLRRGFRLSHAGVAPSATIRVDLTRTHDDLHANLNRRLRTWTRQWPRLGVRVRKGEERDLPTLVRLSALTARFQGFTPFPGSYLTTAYRELADRGHVVLLIAEVAGQPVAAELLTSAGGVLKSRITGMDRDCADTTKLNVASAMIWEAIRWGKVHGYRAFDFGGLRPESVQALRAPGRLDQGRLAKPDIFKTKFGGDLWLYPPAVELIRSPILRTGYDLLRRGNGGQRLVRFARERLRGTR